MAKNKIPLSELHPNLVKEFLTSDNNGSQLDDYTAASKSKVWWKCVEGHLWQANLDNRIRMKSGCPYCSGLRPTLETCFATTNKEELKLWDAEKNLPLTPYEIKAKTNKKLWWKCDKGHSWQAPPSRITNGGRCPYCSNRLIAEENSIKTTHPELLNEWDYEKNISVFPESITSGSSKKVWWKCCKGHSWQTSTNHRIAGKTNCPYCSNQKVGLDNNLLFKYPKIVLEWDYDKNNSNKPNEIAYGSNKRIHWKCIRGHTWIASISARTKSGTNCPYCNPNLSKLELRIFSELIYFFPDTERQKKIWGKEFDISNNKFQFCIEVDGYPWHLNKEEKDLKKNDLCKKNDYLLIRVRDEKLKKLGNHNIFYKESKSKNHLNTIKNIIQILLDQLHLDKILTIQLSTYKNRTEFINSNYYLQLLSDLPGPGKDKSIDVTNPDIAKEFHPTKNGLLLSNMLSIGSGMKLWWQCNNGHEWQAYVYARKNGGCPYCSNLKVNDSNSLQTLFPEVAKEWHPTKNNDLTPNDFVYGSGKKVWWKCSEGHEWYRSIEKRTNYKRGCPYCAGRLLPDTSKYPEDNK